MAAEIKEKIKKQTNNKFSITSDGWSQPTKSPGLYSLTVHAISEDFVRSDHVLATFSLDNTTHSGVNIANNIKKTLEENGLSIANVTMLVRDDASNMRACSNELGVERLIKIKQSKLIIINLSSFQCVCHFLHLVIGDVFKQPNLEEMCQKVTKWVKESRTANGSAIFKRNGVKNKLVMVILY
jgi:hypothetical protein